MNNYSTYLSKHKKDISQLRADAIKLKHDLKRLNIKMKTKDFNIEKDFNTWVEKDRELNNLLLKIETEENYIFPDKKKKPLKISIQKITTRQSKRCG